MVWRGNTAHATDGLDTHRVSREWDRNLVEGSEMVERRLHVILCKSRLPGLSDLAESRLLKTPTFTRRIFTSCDRKARQRCGRTVSKQHTLASTAHKFRLSRLFSFTQHLCLSTLSCLSLSPTNSCHLFVRPISCLAAIMQLRKSVTAPLRLEDEDPTTPNRNPTKPAHAAVMRSVAIPFNPSNLPAAFPSLPFTPKTSPGADKDDPEVTATGDIEVPDTLPTQTSLAGETSGDEEKEESNTQTGLVDLFDEQDSTQQDETPERATEQEVAGLTSLLVAKSSVTDTEVIPSLSPTNM